ncbi:MAG: type 4a pilus biogenesis protein PilO [Candidatus Omnitrophica bacterium]|nr:type 4a pilus biogenesis protein PilO [Candidatus Omnitrophota bacterium]
MKIDFHQLIERFNQLDIKIRYTVFGGVLLLVFLSDYSTVLRFQWNTLSKMDSKNQTMSKDIKRLKDDLQRINQMKERLQNSRTQLEAMNIKIRPLGEASSVLEDISRIANETGVKIDQLTPQTESQQALISTKEARYYTLPIVIRATSGYHMFGRFMNQLELGKLFFIVSSLQIQDQGSDIHHHAIDATLKIIFSDKSSDGSKT